MGQSWFCNSRSWKSCFSLNLFYISKKRYTRVYAISHSGCLNYWIKIRHTLNGRYSCDGQYWYRIRKVGHRYFMSKKSLIPSARLEGWTYLLYICNTDVQKVEYISSRVLWWLSYPFINLVSCWKIVVLSFQNVVWTRFFVNHFFLLH